MSPVRTLNVSCKDFLCLHYYFTLTNIRLLIWKKIILTFYFIDARITFLRRFGRNEEIFKNFEKCGNNLKFSFVKIYFVLQIQIEHLI